MSDKFTVKELTKEIMDAQPRTIADSIAEVAKKYPERFAPEPDPVEEFIAFFCSVCSYAGECGIRINCGSEREALRAYVADLHDKIESLQKAQQLKGGER